MAIDRILFETQGIDLNFNENLTISIKFTRIDCTITVWFLHTILLQ